MRCGLRAVDVEPCGAYGLQREEDKHAGAGCDEELAAPDTVAEERGPEGPDKVPYLENAIDEELDRRARDTDRVENGVKVVGNKPVAAPLRASGLLS